jgi:hypothetical protein
MTNLELIDLMSAAIHENCEATLDECGAGNFHDEEAASVLDALLARNLIVTDGGSS